MARLTASREGLVAGQCEPSRRPVAQDRLSQGVGSVEGVEPTGIVSLAASLGQFAEWAHAAYSGQHKDKPAAKAWQAIVETAATDAVHEHASAETDDQQTSLFNLLVELVGNRDRIAWTILGNPRLTGDDLDDVPPETRDLCVTFAANLHHGLTQEATRPQSPLTNAAVVSRLGHLGTAMDAVRGDLAGIKGRVEDLHSAVADSGARARAEAAAAAPDLSSLPPNVQATLTAARTLDPEGAHRLARHLNGAESQTEKIEALIGADPAPWWKAVSGPTVVAAARHAAAHGLLPKASALYAHAADLEVVNRGRCLALAAFHLADSDRARAEDLLEPARQVAPEDLLVATIGDRFDDDHQAVLSRLGDHLNIDDDEWALLSGIQLWALEVADRPSDAIALSRTGLAQGPEHSGIRLQLAVMLRERAEGNSATRDADLDEAMAAAIAARDLRRRWGGPSNHAVAEACRIATVNDDWDTVIALGLRPPDGDATAVETADPFVIAQVAAAAAIAGRHDIAPTLLPRLGAGFHRSLLEGWVAEAEGDTSSAISHLSAAADAADNDAALSWALRGLAGLGQWPIRQLDQLAETSPEEATVITAVSEITRDLTQDAITRLTPLRRQSAYVPMLLARAYESAGRPDEAVDELQAGFAATADAAMLIYACEILMRAERNDAAEELAIEAMSAIPTRRPLRHRTRRLLIDLALGRGDERRVETLASAAIAEDDPDERVRWDLIHMLHRRNQNDAAWDILQGPPPLVPATVQATLLWLQVHARTGRDRATVQQMLEVVARFGDSEEVQGTALGLFYTLRGDGQVTDTEGAAVQELGATFISRWPQSPFLFAYKVTPDDPAELARQIDDIARLGSAGTSRFWTRSRCTPQRASPSGWSHGSPGSRSPKHSWIDSEGSSSPPTTRRATKESPRRPPRLAKSWRST